MSQHTLPICIECGTVISGYFGRGNRPIFCERPKLCRFIFQDRPLPLCGRPGCRKPFTRDIRKDGKPMVSQRFCGDHQVHEFNQHPCLWCGEPCVDVKNKPQWKSTTLNPKIQHSVHYCCVDHKLLAWNYPGQPKPICSVCHNEIKPVTMADGPEVSSTWFAVMDPPTAHYECWRYMRKEELELYKLLNHMDPRIVQYTLKIQIPEYFKEISAKPTMRVKILHKLDISLHDTEATVDERVRIIQGYHQWQAEQRKLAAKRGMIATKK